MPLRSDCYSHELRKAARRLTARYDAALAPAGITLAQYSLMRTLHHAARQAAPGGDGLSLTELGRRMELDRSTAGRNARVLERAGLVASRPGESDRREATLALTEAGRETLARAKPLWAEAQAAVEAVMGTEQAAALRRMLAEL